MQDVKELQQRMADLQTARQEGKAEEREPEEKTRALLQQAYQKIEYILGLMKREQFLVSAHQPVHTHGVLA